MGVFSLFPGGSGNTRGPQCKPKLSGRGFGFPHPVSGLYPLRRESHQQDATMGSGGTIGGARVARTWDGSTHGRVCFGKKRGPRLSLREEGRNPLRLQEGLAAMGKEGMSYRGAWTFHLQLRGKRRSLRI